MREITVAIRVQMVREGTPNIELIVHNHYLDRPSPCVVIENGVYQGMIGGRIDCLEEILQMQMGKHPRYILTEVETIRAMVPPQVPDQVRIDGDPETVPGCRN